MATYDEIFGGSSKKYLALPKEDGHSITFVFTGEFDKVPQTNFKTKKARFMVKGKDIAGNEKWGPLDEGEFNPDEFEHFPLTYIMTKVVDDEGEKELTWNYKNSEVALKEAMASTGIGLTENTACRVTMTGKQGKEFLFKVELKDLSEGLLTE